jgi:hypothetical protein
MTQYGIKLVWPGWNNDTVMGFSDDGYNRWRESIQPGTRMLLYETEDRSPGTTFRGTKSISGEIEVTGTFKDGEKYPAPTKQHHHLVPVKLLRPRRGGRQVSLYRVRELIGDNGWHRRETWTPLSKEVYERLIAELEK